MPDLLNTAPFGLARRLATGFVAGFVDVLMPPQCVSCKAPTARAGLYCPDCFARLPRIPAPLCDACGISLPIEQAANALCLSCTHAHPPWRHARAAFFYDGPARETVLAFKYGQETLAPLMARAMLAAGRTLVAPDTLIVPVPLHRWRLASRGFNQALLLGRALAKLTGAGVEIDTLRRRKATPRTAGMSAKARARNVAGAFAVPKELRAQIAGRHLLLVDDVMTTGATTAAATRTLLAAGADSVDVLVFARVAAALDNP